MTMNSIVSLLGLAGFMGIAWIFSTNRSDVNWRVIIWGLALQFSFACFIFLVPAGSKFFLAVNELVVKVLDCAARGSEFAFGVLAMGPGKKDSVTIFAFL